MLAYGIIPQAMPQFLTYLLYRWEVLIRTTVVVGFVSAGGLGREFRLSLSFFQYTDVALMILWYLVPGPGDGGGPALRISAAHGTGGLAGSSA